MSKRALIVDDLSSDRVLLGKILRNIGFEVLEAKSGKEGVQMAAAHQPEVIFMDVVMPDISGFQATREITKSPATSKIPVIMVTTKDRAPDKMNSKANGASGHVCKPADENAIKAELAKLSLL